MDDFLVIGGGVAGLTAGAALSGLGRVRVWEAEANLGHHASGRSAALFEERYGAPPVLALNRASRAAHEAAGHLSPRGLMVVGVAGQEARAEADIAAMGLTPLTPEAARARVPILSAAVTRAGWHAEAWDIDTHALMQDAARAIRAAGGAIETGRRAEAIERAGSWLARTGGHVARARVLVIAAGAWADAVARMAGIRPLGLRPLRRSMARLAAPGGHDLSAWPMLLGAGEGWYAKPDAGGWIVSPAEEDLAEPHDAWADDLVLAQGLDRYARAVAVPPTRPRASWAGLRSFAPDRVPALGWAADAGDVLWCAGQGGTGFQTAPAAARHLADIAAGRPPEIGAETAAALDPGRLAARVLA
jgi:glycine/D-amino acid oxidase-like deaminating enzyme